MLRYCATDYKAVKGIRKNVRFAFIAGHEPSGVVAHGGQDEGIPERKLPPLHLGRRGRKRRGVDVAN